MGWNVGPGLYSQPLPLAPPHQPGVALEDSCALVQHSFPRLPGSSPAPFLLQIILTKLTIFFISNKQIYYNKNFVQLTTVLWNAPDPRKKDVISWIVYWFETLYLLTIIYILISISACEWTHELSTQDAILGYCSPASGMCRLYRTRHWEMIKVIKALPLSDGMPYTPFAPCPPLLSRSTPFTCNAGTTSLRPILSLAMVVARLTEHPRQLALSKHGSFCQCPPSIFYEYTLNRQWVSRAYKFE